MTAALPDIVAELGNRGIITHRHILLSLLFDKQLEFVLSPAKRKAAHPGRRGGKSFAVAVDCCLTALENPKAMIPYIAKTRDHARRIMWPVLREIANKCGLTVHFNETMLRATFENGAVIWLTGADKIDDIEKLRGDKYPKVFIDECGALGRFIQYLVEDVLRFALMDYDGSVIMVGTPPPNCAGYFHEVCHSSTWEVFHWTVLDNPKFPLWDGREDWREFATQWIEKTRVEEGWSEGNPTFLREFYGKWITDSDGLVYKFKPGRNTYTNLPNRIWKYVIGVDFGYTSISAWTIWAYTQRGEKCMYLLEEYDETGLMPHQISEITHKFIQKYPKAIVVADPGALGAAIIKEMRVRYVLPVVPAEKRNKHEYIELFNSDLFEGRIKVSEDAKIIEEWENHQWETDVGEFLGDRKRSEGSTANHYSDSALYAWRHAYHFVAKGRKVTPEPGTEKYENWRMEKLFEEDAKNNGKEDSALFSFGRTMRLK